MILPFDSAKKKEKKTVSILFAVIICIFENFVFQMAYLVLWLKQNLIIFGKCNQEYNWCYILETMNPFSSFGSLSADVYHSVVYFFGFGKRKCHWVHFSHRNKIHKTYWWFKKKLAKIYIEHNKYMQKAFTCDLCQWVNKKRCNYGC